MYDIDSINSLDFFFNGNYLSSFGGIIAGKDGMRTLSLTPSLDIKSEKILGKHGELVYNATYNPRTFTVPVMFSDTSRIREISKWLGVLEPKDFYFIDDSVKIKCMIDTALDLERYCYQSVVDLKFIAHDPVFREIEENVMVINSNLISGKTIFNDGNKESHPLIKIIGNGDISMGINGDAFTVKGVDGYVYVDMLYCTCYKDSTNKMPYFEGDFIPLPNGESTIALIGNYTGVEITFRSEWI